MRFIFVFLLFTTHFDAFAEDTTEYKLDSGVVKAVIKTHLPLFKKCYDEEYRKDPSLKGKIVIAWMFSETGVVTKSWIKSSKMNNKAVEDCLVETVKTLKFPNARKGTVAEVQYPFRFQPAQ